jgi:DNA processing protein
MPGNAETTALIALLRGGRRPWTVYTELVEQAGSASAVLEAERRSGGIASQQPRLFGDAGAEGSDPVGIATEIAAWAADGINVLTVLEEGYPENLRAVHDRPPLLFVAGDIAPADARSVAVVGARIASEEGVAATTEIARHLVGDDYVVVSGLAAGIDAAAHRTALAHGGRTVAVIGTGLRRSYPPENAALQRRIAAEHAVISQFWPDSPPSKRSFPMRNAVMSGFSLGTVVVEAAHTSGSRIQARLSLEQGRPVFLWHTVLRHDWARTFAKRPGTHVVSDPAEITAVLERLTSSGTLVA